MSMSNSPCAACKCLRRKCTQDCAFAPYFPPDNPQKFTNVHKVFGASNVAKLLNELGAAQREDAVNSLAYEAECRLRDPVYGCVGLISILQQKLKQVQHDLDTAKKELATYIGPAAMLPMLQNHPAAAPFNYAASPYQVAPPYNSQMIVPEHQHQQFLEAQQMLRIQQLQQSDMVRFSNGFDDAGAVVTVTAAGFNQMGGVEIQHQQQQPSLALGNSYEAAAIPFHVQNHGPVLQQQQQQPPLVVPQAPQSQTRGKSEEPGSIGPSP
ncbi:LOB domain-containing protein 36-like [Andrographis paniculata]|uniref:LOB domain-containing protein 36-like n=1 Tax=Andrographis paniculata TaxID=175694 RepID=UPI0021E77FBF|nr:LOB domain-containing protein 36-like [Andrographis paniculata]XP_051117359.1 LOB domain-containing protein 36-like [Andrographis paniculata]XP_051117365.1 LOB domain-containing protein 36-like [Andrographis paniculata]XP_051117372.1 LOB domain-containing protein 36-like [Andrographis paniculata]